MNAERLLAHYERVADAPDTILRLRKFVLDLAVRGKLVPQDPSDEPALKLLDGIRGEQFRFSGTAATTRADSWREGATNDLPFDVRTGWVATRICEVVLELQTGPFGSSLHQSDYQLGGTPVINPASIQSERIVPIEKMAVGSTTLERLSAFKVRAGDIVLGRRGEMGRCAVVTASLDFHGPELP